MPCQEQLRNLILIRNRRTGSVIAALAMVLALVIFNANRGQAQAFTVLHNFTGAGDGSFPTAGLTIDAAGNLYGTTEEGGTANGGTVFKLTRRGSGWTFAPLYSFQGGNDGDGPQSSVTIGTNGSLYGTTASGGGGCKLEGCGTVFNLRPPAVAPRSALAPWTETVLYRFDSGNNGANPAHDALVFDQAGNLYGTAQYGGSGGFGVVFTLTPSNGGWVQSLVYSFTGTQDGKFPLSGVAFDHAGNLYGTTSSGGTYGLGTVYQLTPSGSGWTETTLHSFSGGSDGAFPWGGLFFDSSGNGYGMTSGGDGGEGTVYELTPANGSWTYGVIYNFTGNDGQGPVDSPIMDASGNLYGTALNGGLYGYGSVFKLTPSDGGWSFTSLHNFCGGGYPCNDGINPYGSLVFDASGNLYGTAYSGGSYGDGVVFKIAP